jgi:hypothetical protein
MASASKTFKIGEYAKGGVITVEVKGKIVTVIGKDWDYSKGSNKGSDQSNAKEFTRGTIDSTEGNAYNKVSMFVNDLTTSYYTDQILEWIETKVKLNRTPWTERVCEF